MENTMDFSLVKTPEEKQFQRELHEFLDRELTDEIRCQHALDKGIGPEARAFARKLGARGWLGMGWPAKYGGSGGSLRKEYILVQEFARREAYVPNLVARFMVGPVILHQASEYLKQAFLPRIARGEIEFSLGYTEPSAGSDLAAIRMTAVEESDCFIINGQKIFNTQSHYADYHWLAVKTDPEAPKHNSITLFIVDQRAPGISIHPIRTMGGELTNSVFYDNVRVPKDRLVGRRNHGFRYMIEALGHERIMLFQNERLVPVLNRLVLFAREQKRNGIPLAELPVVRDKLAQIATEIEVAKCLESWAFAGIIEGQPNNYESEMVKLFGSEVRQRFAYFALDILGKFGRLEEGSKWAPLQGEIARLSRATVLDTIGGGSSEIIRNIIATRGLKLPADRSQM